MKRGALALIVILGLFCSLFVLSLSFVSAYTDVQRYVQQGVDAFVDITKPVLQALLGGTTWNSTYLFEKVLFFIIVASLVFLALKQIPAFEDQPGIVKLLALIVPLIGVRFIDTAWIEALLIQYQLLAIVLAGFLPFFLFFFFIHKIGEQHDLIRKIGWIFFIVVYFGLWSTAPEGAHGDIYLWTMVASFLFFLFDGTIHNYLLRQELKRVGADTIYEAIAKINQDIAELRNPASGLSPRIRDRLIRKKEKDKQRLYKSL